MGSGEWWEREFADLIDGLAPPVWEGWFICDVEDGGCGWIGDVQWVTDEETGCDYAECPVCEKEMEITTETSTKEDLNVT